MTRDDAEWFTRLVLGGCCIPCVAVQLRVLAGRFPDTSWLDVAKAFDPDHELFAYLEDPEGWQ